MTRQARILHMVLAVVALALALWAVQPAAGDSRTDYPLDGANVATFVLCGPQGRLVIHSLEATDGQARIYNLGLDMEGYDVAHVGRVAVEGQRLIWLQHYPGDKALVQYSGGPCEVGAPQLSDRWFGWLPLITR